MHATKDKKAEQSKAINNNLGSARLVPDIKSWVRFRHNIVSNADDDAAAVGAHFFLPLLRFS